MYNIISKVYKILASFSVIQLYSRFELIYKELSCHHKVDKNLTYDKTTQVPCMQFIIKHMHVVLVIIE